MDARPARVETGVSAGHQVGERRIGQQLRCRAAPHDAAAAQHHAAAGDAEREAGALLAQQDRRAVGGHAPRAARSRSATTSGARPSVGSSSSSRRGRSIRARASASICCWPPDSSQARASGPLAEHGEQRQHLLDPLAALDGRQARRRLEVLAHGEAGEDAAGPRARSPRPARRAARPAATLTSCPNSRSPRRGRKPRIVSSSVVLPAPLPPSSATISPAATAKLPISSTVGSCRVRRQAEEARPHPRIGAHLGGRPTAMTAPRSRQTRRSQTRVSSSMS